MSPTFPGIGEVNDKLDVFFSVDGTYAFGYVGEGADSTTKFLQDRSKIILTQP